MTYRERLATPWWWWLVGLGLAVLTAAEIHSGARGATRAVVPYVGLPVLAVLLLLLMSRGSLRVADGVLHVPGGRAPLTSFGPPQALDRRGARLALGRTDAFYCVRPWMPGAVLLPVTDPADPTAFWLVGTRRATELAAVVGSGRH